MFMMLMDYIRMLLFLTGYVSGSATFPKPLTAEEEQIYIRQFQNGSEEAKNILIERNLRLVAHIVKKYEKSSDDLISIGTIGLIKGINTFDPDKNARLSSYVSRCIENEVLMYLRSSQKQCREISMEDSIGVDKEGNNMTIADILVADGSDIYENVRTEMETKMLYDVMDKVLSPTEKNIIIWRYGLGNTRKKTQNEIAGILGISRSYVSRIEKRCLNTMLEELKKQKIY